MSKSIVMSCFGCESELNSVTAIQLWKKNLAKYGEDKIKKFATEILPEDGIFAWEMSSKCLGDFAKKSFGADMAPLMLCEKCWAKIEQDCVMNFEKIRFHKEC